jgi:UTP--glucose-1-phosphate uridylyltransferase
MVEKPKIEEAPSRLAALGRYVITPDVFEILEHTKPGKGGEIQLTDALKDYGAQRQCICLQFQGQAL